ncbi:MAG: anti-sigma factor [Dehalococcoidia bacterium]|nr:anti-sigma factor [Dehalococcoidia bacterium]
MIWIDCETARESIDAYVIGALDSDELPAFRAHVAACDACAHLIEEARDGAAAVALSVPLVPASSALKARVMASAAVLTPRARRPRPIARLRGWPAVAAALLVVSIAALAWGAAMQHRAGDLGARNDAATARAADAGAQLASLTTWQQGMLRIAGQPDVARTDLMGTALAPSARGTYIWSASQRTGAFLGSGLPPLPKGQTYQFWFVYSGTWESAGACVRGADGSARLIVRRDEGAANDDAGPVRGFAVTIEPANGSGQRTGALVLQSALN